MLPHRDGIRGSEGGEGMGRTEGEELEESKKVGNVERAGERNREKKHEGVLVARSVWLTGPLLSQSGREAGGVKTENRAGEK
jgi:hypothetical protein